jgi:cell volume regulation protein A
LSDVVPFGLVVTLVSVAALVAVLTNRVSERFSVPTPAIFLVCAAVASDLIPSLGELSITTVQRIVTIALVAILFDGGMRVGRRRWSAAAWPITWVGVAGTVVTAGAVAAACHLLFDLDWLTALLIGTAVAPTDPAVVFSVLGRREVTGRSAVILEGESGVNDPVGIALMASLLAVAGTNGLGAVGIGIREFVLQMGVGAAVGLLGGHALVAFIRRVPLPSEALYPLRTLAAAFVIYGVASVGHGSGFLAVFVAGIIVGDVRAPYKGEIERFHSSLASLGEIVAFAVLGLTVPLHTLPDADAWLIGLIIAVLLTFLIRPLLVGLLLWPVRLRAGERVFILWAGLKGAVPILLGTFILAADTPQASSSYAIIFVVVAFSVIVQGGLVPAVARRARVPMQPIEPEPWSLGVRLRHEPRGLRRYLVADQAPAAGRAIDELDLGEGVWITMLIRDGQLLPIRSDTVLQPGDEMLALVDPDHSADPAPLFAPPRPR